MALLFRLALGVFALSSPLRGSFSGGSSVDLRLRSTKRICFSIKIDEWIGE